MVGDSHTETDYLTHVQQLVATDPNAIKWHLVMDCLNISQSLVRLWHTEGLEIDLGKKANLAFSNRCKHESFLVTPATKSYFTLRPNTVPAQSD